MRARTPWLMIVIALVAVAAIYSGIRYAEYARREAYIKRCNEDGEGGMFTSRQYCEQLYEKQRQKR